MIIKMLLVVASIAWSFAAVAENKYKLTMDTLVYDFDFVAPIVASDADVPARAGLIYYDVGVGLKVINPSGVPETISAGTSGSPVISSNSGVVKIFSAHIVGGNPSPTISRQDGSWISFNTRAAAGDYTWSLNTGCATVPNCTTACTPGAANQICRVLLDKAATGSTTRSTTALRTQLTGVSDATTDTAEFDIICACAI